MKAAWCAHFSLFELVFLPQPPKHCWKHPRRVPKPGIHRFLDSLAFFVPSVCQQNSREGGKLIYGARSFCRHLQQPEHKILQQLRSHGYDVFVVTEVLQTQEEMQVTRTHNKEGSGQFAVPGAISLQVCG